MRVVCCSSAVRSSSFCSSPIRPSRWLSVWTKPWIVGDRRAKLVRGERDEVRHHLVGALEREPRRVLLLEQANAVERDPDQRRHRAKRLQLVVAEERRVPRRPHERAVAPGLEHERLGAGRLAAAGRPAARSASASAARPRVASSAPSASRIAAARAPTSATTGPSTRSAISARVVASVIRLPNRLLQPPLLGDAPASAQRLRRREPDEERCARDQREHPGDGGARRVGAALEERDDDRGRERERREREQPHAPACDARLPAPGAPQLDGDDDRQQRPVEKERRRVADEGRRPGLPARRDSSARANVQIESGDRHREQEPPHAQRGRRERRRRSGRRSRGRARAARSRRGARAPASEPVRMRRHAGGPRRRSRRASGTRVRASPRRSSRRRRHCQTVSTASVRNTAVLTAPMTETSRCRGLSPGRPSDAMRGFAAACQAPVSHLLAGRATMTHDDARPRGRRRPGHPLGGLARPARRLRSRRSRGRRGGARASRADARRRDRARPLDAAGRRPRGVPLAARTRRRGAGARRHRARRGLRPRRGS